MQKERKGRQDSGAVTVTSKTQGSPSTALSDAAFPTRPLIFTLTGMLSSSVFTFLFQHPTWCKQNMEVRGAAGNRSSLQPEASRDGHKEGQREPRTCPGPMPRPALHATLNARRLCSEEQQQHREDVQR